MENPASWSLASSGGAELSAALTVLAATVTRKSSPTFRRREASLGTATARLCLSAAGMAPVHSPSQAAPAQFTSLLTDGPPRWQRQMLCLNRPLPGDLRAPAGEKPWPCSPQSEPAWELGSLVLVTVCKDSPVECTSTFIHVFTHRHIVIELLLCAGPVPGSGGTRVSKSGKILCPQGLTFCWKDIEKMMTCSLF